MMKVIDISAWQEWIDWQAVKDAGIKGVILKIGEHYKLDEKFIEHVNNAVAYGLPYGVYYYSHASFIHEAVAEANWLINRLRHILMEKILNSVFGMMLKIKIC